jgi:hypothetical protein
MNYNSKENTHSSQHQQREHLNCPTPPQKYNFQHKPKYPFIILTVNKLKIKKWLKNWQIKQYLLYIAHKKVIISTKGGKELVWSLKRNI